jgi:hypothetical protein
MDRYDGSMDVAVWVGVWLGKRWGSSCGNLLCVSDCGRDSLDNRERQLSIRYLFGLTLSSFLVSSFRDPGELR